MNTLEDRLMSVLGDNLKLCDKKKAFGIYFLGKRITNNKGKSVWNSVGAAKNAFHVFFPDYKLRSIVEEQQPDLGYYEVKDIVDGFKHRLIASGTISFEELT